MLTTVKLKLLKQKQMVRFRSPKSLILKFHLDTNSGAVARNRAANELAQLKQEDPTPLRRAKLTQEASLKKVEKERKAAEAATVAVEEQTKKVEAAYRDTENKVAEAEELLEKAKKSGSAQGAVWWLERELKEAQKYLPKRKQQQ